MKKQIYLTFLTIALCLSALADSTNQPAPPKATTNQTPVPPAPNAAPAPQQLTVTPPANQPPTTPVIVTQDEIKQLIRLARLAADGQLAEAQGYNPAGKDRETQLLDAIVFERKGKENYRLLIGLLEKLDKANK